jgi:hypothetical protein
MDEPGGGTGAKWLSAIERHMDTLLAGPAGSGTCKERQLGRVLAVMRAFYAYVLFLAFPWSSAASVAWTSSKLPRPKLQLEVAALVPVDHWDSVRVLACLLLIGCSIVLCLRPTLRIPRYLVAASFVLVTAMHFDLEGKVEHGHHPALWVAIGLCFLPGRPVGAAARSRFVASFFGVQVLVATLYSSAGLCKLVGTAYDRVGGVTWFHSEALPLMITGNWDRSSTTLLGGWLVLHPGLAGLCQLSAFVLEFGALPAVFFRRLQQPWALLLITMHVMILHSMKIHFHQSCLILVLFLVLSPFAPPLRGTAVNLLTGVRARFGAIRPSRAVAANVPMGDRSLGMRTARFWGPVAAVLYLVLAFSRFEPSRGAFRQELYPVSPMAMFFRLHPTPQGLEKVAALRAKLEKKGLFPGRTKRLSAKAKRERAR